MNIFIVCWAIKIIKEKFFFSFFINNVTLSDDGFSKSLIICLRYCIHSRCWPIRHNSRVNLVWPTDSNWRPLHQSHHPWPYRRPYDDHGHVLHLYRVHPVLLWYSWCPLCKWPQHVVQIPWLLTLEHKSAKKKKREFLIFFSFLFNKKFFINMLLLEINLKKVHCTAC